MNWDDEQLEDLHGLYAAVNACETRQQADMLMAAYRPMDEYADANVAFVIGRVADDVTRERLRELFQIPKAVAQ